MRRALALTLVAFVPVLLTSCGDSTGPSGEVGDIEDFFPIVVGTTYEYDVTGTSVEEQRDCTIEGTILRTFLEAVAHDGGFDVFPLEENQWGFEYCPSGSTSYAYTDTMYFRATDSQLLMYEDLESDTAFVFLQEPIALGETWSPFPGQPDVVAEIGSVTETLVVPAGTFTNCVRVDITMTGEPDFYLGFHLRRDVGLVKFEELSPESSRTDVLRSYRHD